MGDRENGVNGRDEGDIGGEWGGYGVSEGDMGGWG